MQSLVTLLPIAYSCSQCGSEFLLLFVQSTPDNSNLQRKSKKGSSYDQLSGVRVTGSSKKMAESKVKNSFYCTVNISITFNCTNVK